MKDITTMFLLKWPRASSLLRANAPKGGEEMASRSISAFTCRGASPLACSLAISNPGQAGRQLHTITSILEIKVPHGQNGTAV